MSNWGPVSRGVVAFACALAVVSCATPSLEEERELTRLDSRIRARFDEGAPARVFLITVGGLAPSDYLDPFGHAVADGARVHMPVLARLAREGATGLSALPPSPGSTRASHATLVTGQRPARHGVLADSALDGEGTRALPFLDSRLLQATALWDAALGRGVVSLGWPTTSGARIEMLLPEDPQPGADGWLDRVRGGTSPVLMRELEAIASEAVSVGAEITGRLPWPNAAERDAALVELACRLISSERDAGLWLLRLDQTVPTATALGVGGVEFVDVLARVDAEIARVIDCLQQAGRLADTALFVTGDVAYLPVHTTVSPNVALVRAGLIGRDPRASTGVRSWLALVRSNGSSAFVYARDAANALEARTILEAEAERTDGFRVLSAKALGEAGGDPQAWFGLVAEPGYLLGDQMVGPRVRPSGPRGAAGVLRSGAAADAKSEVGFVAWGRGIRNSVRLPRVELVDVAPTIAALLGLRLDDDLDGEAILGILRAAVPPPPPGPKRLGTDRTPDERLRDLRTGRGVGPSGTSR